MLLQIEPQLFPQWLTLAVTVPKSHQLLLARDLRSHDHQQAMLGFFQTRLEREAVHPELHIAFGAQVSMLPCLEFILPGRLAPTDRRGREPRRIQTQQGFEGFGEVPRGHAFPLQPWQPLLDAS